MASVAYKMIEKNKKRHLAIIEARLKTHQTKNLTAETAESAEKRIGITNKNKTSFLCDLCVLCGSGFSTALLRNLNSTLIRILRASAMMLMCSVGFGQVDIESIARLHFTIESEPDNWFEGYDSILSGSFSPYSSHRSGPRRDSAFVARTSGGEAMIEWQTATVPLSWKGDSASFLWVCGFGNNLGNEWFDLEIDNSFALSFSTPNNSSWTVSGKGGSLAFVTAARNSNGANLGYMALTVPRSRITPNKPLTVRVRGRKSNTEVWFRLFAYRDAIQFLQRKERRDFFSHVELWNFGEASLTLCGRRRDAGSIVRVLSSGKVIAEERLRPDGIIAKTSVLIPRHLQPSNDQITSIQVAGKNVDAIHWDQINRRRLRAFLEEQLECDRYVFPPGEFPEVRWKRPAMVDNEMGKFSLKLAYYDKNMRQVTRAEKTGRYAAVVEGVLPSGFTMRRFITLYCSPVEFDDYSENIPLKFNRLKDYGISEAQWRLYERSENRFAFGTMKMFPRHEADAAVFLAGLSEIDSVASRTDTPRLRDRQWWITFKQPIYGKGAVPLSLPKKENETSLLLEENPVSTSPFNQTYLKQIRNVCRAWASDAAEPHVALIAYKGRIVFHEAFNTKVDEFEVAIDSPFWMASITKLLTGVLMMQFVDQGLVELGAPIEKYLPELSSAVESKLKVRHLFTHTTGLDGWAGEWASDWNSALENQVAQVLPFLKVGEKFSYHRAGYAIAGKIMERITGRAVPYLFQDYLFTPLGMKSAYADNTYGGLYCTAADLARLGQMLLNRGTLNGYRFFSEDSYRQFLPAKLAGIDRRWGIGTSPMEGHGLSGEAFGHAAASGAVFRVDPKNDLIIVSARNKVSGNQEEFEKRLIEACTAPFRRE